MDLASEKLEHVGVVALTGRQFIKLLLQLLSFLPSEGIANIDPSDPTSTSKTLLATPGSLVLGSLEKSLGGIWDPLGIQANLVE